MAGRPDTPVLAEGTRIARQVEDGQVRFVVRAGESGKYVRVGEAEKALLDLMDGSRTLPRIRTGYMAARREGIDLREIASFLAQMRRLRVVEETEEAKNLLLVEKARQRRKERRFAGRVGSVFFLRFKLFDPERILRVVTPPLRFLFTRTFVVLALLLFAAAVVVLVHRWDEVAGRLRNIGLITAGSGVSLLSLWTTALVVVFVHEFGHGVACKHFGGEVHEMGFLLLFFQPCFYANVNDAWTFESRAARLWVTAAGGFIEIVLGSAAVLVWAATEPGSLLHGVAYVTFMISLSSSLLFNLNPLIKLDGYYLLADLVRIENLRDRAFGHLGWLVRHRLLGLPAPPTTQDPREARIFTLYALGSIAYMGLLVGTLLSVVLGSLFGEGKANPIVVLVMASLCWLILRRPLAVVGGAMKEIARSNRDRLRSPRFWIAAGASAAGLAAVSFLLPWTRTSAGFGRAEPWRVTEVRSPVEGRVVEVLVREGDSVAEGDLLARIASPVEAAAARVARERAGALARAALALRAAGDAAGAASAEKEAEAASTRAADLEQRVARREVRSPHAGRVLTRRPEEREGAVVAREEPILTVGDGSRVRVRVQMDARSVGPVREGMDARVRLRAWPGDPLEGAVVSVSRQAIPEEQNLLTEMTGPHWEVVVEAPDPDGRALAGMSGEVEVLVERTTVAGALGQGIRSTFRSDLLR